MALVDHHGSIHNTHSAPWTAPSRQSGHCGSFEVRSCSSFELRKSGVGPDGPDAGNPLNLSYITQDQKAIDGTKVIGHNDKRNEKQTNPQPQLNFEDTEAETLQKDTTLEREHSFRRWMKSLRKKSIHGSSARSSSNKLKSGHAAHQNGPSGNPSLELLHRRASSDSSLGFVQAVRSASASLSSFSVVARSRRTTARSHGLSRTDQSSRASFVGPRISEDSALTEAQVVPDIAAVQRSAQRRRILEELISTEESYISDLRFLTTVGFQDFMHSSPRTDM